MDSDLVSFDITPLFLVRALPMSCLYLPETKWKKLHQWTWIGWKLLEAWNNNNVKTKKVPVNGQFLRTAVSIQSTNVQQHTDSLCVEWEKIYVRLDFMKSSSNRRKKIVRKKIEFQLNYDEISRRATGDGLMGRWRSRRKKKMRASVSTACINVCNCRWSINKTFPILINATRWID